MTGGKVVGALLLLALLMVVAAVEAVRGSGRGHRRNSKYLFWEEDEGRDQRGLSSSSSLRGDRKLVFISNKAYDLTEAEESHLWEFYLRNGHLPRHTDGWTRYNHLDSLEAAMMAPNNPPAQALDTATTHKRRDQEDVSTNDHTHQENKDNSQSTSESDNINHRLQENTYTSQRFEDNADTSQSLQENTDTSQSPQENVNTSQILQENDSITQRLQDNKTNNRPSSEDDKASHLKFQDDNYKVQKPQTERDDNDNPPIKQVTENIKMSRFVADPEKLKLVKVVNDSELQKLYSSTVEELTDNSADEKVEVTEVHYEATKVDPLTFIWQELLNLGEALGRELFDTVSGRIMYLWNSFVRFVQARSMTRRALQSQSWDL